MSDLKKIHNGLKELLSEFHNLCVENEIKYSLSGGSLLGAIREGGFIPWDDDADVLMERKEYNKLIKVLPKRFDIINVLWVPRLVYKGATGVESGRSIDIFVLDNAPNNKLKHRIKVLKLRILQGTLKKDIQWSSYDFKGKVLTFGTYCLGKLMSEKVKLNWYEKVAQSNNNEKTRYLGNYKNEYTFISMRYDKNLFLRYMIIPFEDIKLSCIESYDLYLTKAYGNYMLPPPKNEQQPKHKKY